MYFLKRLSLLLLVVLLAACGATPVAENNIQESWSEDDLTDFVSEIGYDLQTMVGQEVLGFNILAALPTNAPLGNFTLLGDLTSLGSPEETLQAFSQLSFLNLQDITQTAAAPLPRGNWVINDQGVWQQTGTSNDLTLQFPFINLDGSSTVAKVTINWDYGAPTTQVQTAAGLIELPTDMQLTLHANGANLGTIDVETDWYKSSCGYRVLDLTKLALKAKFSQGTESLGFGINLDNNNQTSNKVDVTGYINYKAADDSANLTFSSTVHGNLDRTNGCQLADYKAVKGDLSAELTINQNNEKNAMGISFEFNKPVLDLNTGYYSLTVPKGVVTANKQSIASFYGVLDDSNKNGLPGENLSIKFGDGSKTNLEAMLSGL